MTGSSGLIGSEVCTYFGLRGWTVHGVDNNQRAIFFGTSGDTRWNQARLERELPEFAHHELDVRDREGVHALIMGLQPHAIVHAAAQPSHDLAASIPYDDFDTNAVGTLNLLEATRQLDHAVPFVFLSTNKVYGDAPNEINLVERETRWEYSDAVFENGIPETMRVDQSKHSLFGSSKLAADILVQEYGRYFGMPTCCLRGGCLTGPNHAGVELHGFLSYLIRCNLEGLEYRIFGYKGKQVRDNIHAFDVARLIDLFIESPRSGEVYNIGGGKQNSCSILEAFERAESLSGRRMQHTYVDEARLGDHICYYTDLSKLRSHFPGWDITRSLDDIFAEIHTSWLSRLNS